MRKNCLVLSVAAALASCGAPTVDDQVLTTKMACLTKAGELFSDVKKATESEPLMNAAGNTIATNETAGKTEALLPGESFRFVTTGKFIYDAPSASLAGVGPVTCTGDFNRKTIETINHNGLDKRPATGEVWSI